MLTWGFPWAGSSPWIGQMCFSNAILPSPGLLIAQKVKNQVVFVSSNYSVPIAHQSVFCYANAPAALYSLYSTFSVTTIESHPNICTFFFPPFSEQSIFLVRVPSYLFDQLKKPLPFYSRLFSSSRLLFSHRFLRLSRSEQSSFTYILSSSATTSVSISAFPLTPTTYSSNTL